MPYANPILPGFHPDPSICRSGPDYYLINSTFEYFPGVPLFHSQDLVHWRQLTHCLSRPSQLPLEKAGSSGGIYAPSIRFHNGTFYMITTNLNHKPGHFLVTATNPAGPWSEPLWLEGAGIDPSLFFDDDGTVYFTYAADGITQSTLDLATGKTSEPRVIWRGTGGAFPEGPHLYKINGLYYLLIAEGGTEYGHMVTIARSASPWGPWESCPQNPILSHRSLNSPIQATGHADLLQAHDGSWWLVCLGIRPENYPYFHCLGRETFLAPVTWEEAWPSVNLGKPIQLSMDVLHALPPHPWPAEPTRDEFTAPEWPLAWNFLRNPRMENYARQPHALTLRGTAVSLHDNDSPTWVGQRQTHKTMAVTTHLAFTPAGENEEAGLTIRQNDWSHYEIALTIRAGKPSLVAKKRIGDLRLEVAVHPLETLPAAGLTLGIDATPQQYALWFDAGGGKTILATGPARYLATEVAGGFTGVYFALYATGNGAPCTNPATFTYFESLPT